MDVDLAREHMSARGAIAGTMLLLYAAVGACSGDDDDNDDFFDTGGSGADDGEGGQGNVGEGGFGNEGGDDNPPGGAPNGGALTGGAPPGGFGGEPGTGGTLAGGAFGSCEAISSCVSTIDIGSVRGDSGDDMVSERGTRSTFVAVEVTEDSAWVGGLSVQATLTSPPGTNFDLYLYRPDEPGQLPVCVTPIASATGSGVDTLLDSWDDSWWGSNDTRFVVLEVRHVEGTCGEDWVLEVLGNAD